MALFQSNVLCTETNEVTPCGTQYLEHKENGHCYKCTNRESHRKAETLSLFSKWRHVCQTCFDSRKIMLVLPSL